MAEPKKKMFIHGPELEQFPYPESCPFKTSRAGKVFEKLQSMGLLKGGDKVVLAPERATDADLLKFHSEPYLKALKRIDRGEYEMGMLMMQLGTGDCGQNRAGIARRTGYPGRHRRLLWPKQPPRCGRAALSNAIIDAT